MLRRFVKPVGVALIIILIFMAAGFRINHPQYGLSSALGSAKSSLAIYKHGAQPTVGAKVVVKGAYNLLSAKKNAGEMAC